MTFENPSRDRIKVILKQTKNIAVVGLSDNPERTSHMVTKAMQMKGYRIIPVNPHAEEILGEKCYPSLLDVQDPIDLINVFRRSEHTVDVALEAIKTTAQVLWLQQGVFNEEAAKIAQDNGMEVIMDRCIKVEDSILNP